MIVVGELREPSTMRLTPQRGGIGAPGDRLPPRHQCRGGALQDLQLLHPRGPEHRAEPACLHPGRAGGTATHVPAQGGLPRARTVHPPRHPAGQGHHKGTTSSISEEGAVQTGRDTGMFTMEAYQSEFPGPAAPGSPRPRKYSSHPKRSPPRSFLPVPARHLPPERIGGSAGHSEARRGETAHTASGPMARPT